MKKSFGKEDKLVSDLMKDFRMEVPAEGFTERVMQNIHVQRGYIATADRPLISTRGWIALAVGLVAIIVLAILTGNGASTADQGSMFHSLPDLNLPTFSEVYQDFMERYFYVSPTLFWICAGIGGLILMVVVERVYTTIRSRLFQLP